MGVTPVTVRAWRTRFVEEGLAQFAVVRGGRGRKPGITPGTDRGEGWNDDPKPFIWTKPAEQILEQSVDF